MSSFRTRVRKKGKRWVKGQSSTSNPTLKIHRNTATNNFFRDDLKGAGQSLLTADALRRHNDLTTGSSGLKSATSSIVDCGDTNTSYNGSVKTFNTFASDWSCCTNVTFNRLLNRFDLSSAHHKEMLAVLAAVTEVIKSQGGQENTVEYFGALVTTLDGINLGEGNDDSVSAVLSLLAMCIKSVPKEIMQNKFSVISKTFMRYFVHYKDSEHNIILKSLLACLANLLRLQDRVIWNDSSTLHMYDSIMKFALHSKSKIRKAGQNAIISILRGSDFSKEDNSIPHPAARRTAEQCIEILKKHQMEEGNFTILTHMLNLLKDIISTFPKSELKKCCDAILTLMTAQKNPILKSLGLQTLHSLLSSKPHVTCFATNTNAQLINALYDHRPYFTDVQLSMAWFAAMQEAFCNLARNDLELAMLNVPKLFDVCGEALRSTKREVIDNAAISLGAVLKDCFEPAATEENVHLHLNSILKVYKILNECLKHQYSGAWKQILFLLQRLYKACGKTCHLQMMDCLKSLASLREMNDFAHVNEIDTVFGFAIESMGPEVIIDHFPVEIIEYPPDRYEVKYSWLLPLLKQFTKRSTLAAFFNNKNLYHRAVEYRARSKALEKAGRKVGERTYDLLQSQIWALLPSFCDEAQDIRESFPLPNIGKKILDLLDENDLNSIIMAAVRKLVYASSQNDDDKSVLVEKAIYFIVRLFNVYVDRSNGNIAGKSAAAETIKAYLTICNDDVYMKSYNVLLQKLKEVEKVKESDSGTSREAKVQNSDSKREDFLDIMRLLVPYLPPKQLRNLFDEYIVKVQTHDLKLKEEKQYYRLLEEMCSCHTDRCNGYVFENFAEIKNLLLNTVSKAPLPCRGPRIRTAKALLQYDSAENVILEFLPEAVMCCKEGNKRCRTCAFELVRYMAELMESRGETGMARYLDAICSGLGGNASMMAASILALTSTVHCYRGRIMKDAFEAILSNICSLAKCPTREIVGPALGFLKLVITGISTDHVVVNLKLIVETLSGMTDDCKRKYRQKLGDLYERLIRKYGAATIVCLVPTHDAVTMKRVKALKKIDDKKARNRLESRKEMTKKTRKTTDNVSIFSAKQKSQTIDDILAKCTIDDEMSVEEDSDDDNRKKKKKSATNIYLTEDADSIIDFASASASRNILMDKPNKKSKTLIDSETSKKDEFPVTSDGRIIIKEERTERPTRNADIDSDDSIASDAEAQTIGFSRKRKMNDTSEQPSRKKYQAGGSGIHRKIKAKKAENHQPYEYIPLSRNMLNKRKKKKASGSFKNIIKRGKKGKKN